MTMDSSDGIIMDDLILMAKLEGKLNCSVGSRSGRLDFTDGILDSPEFRATLKGKYSTFEDINSHFKVVIKNALAVKEQQKKTLAAYKVLLHSIKEHKVPQGEDMLHDEMTAYNAVGDFVDMMHQQEENCQRVQEAGLDALVAGLQSYQRLYTENIKEDFKKFRKATEKYCHSQEKYLSVSTKKASHKGTGDSTGSSGSTSIATAMPPGIGTFEEDWLTTKFVYLMDPIRQLKLDRTMMSDTNCFHNVATDIVWNVLETEEQTRLNFIQHVYEFTRAYLASFIWGYLENVKRFQGYYPFLEDTISSSQKQLQLTAEEAQALRSHILKDPQLALEQKKQMYDKQGYLWVHESSKKKVIASTVNNGLASSKYFCQYRGKERHLWMTQYHQVNPPKHQLDVAMFTVKQCCRRATSESERQFLFDLSLENNEKGAIQLTMQAQSNEDRAQWLNVMEGEEPIYEDYRKYQSLGVYELDERGLEFIDFIINAIEREGGLEQEGTFRKPGGAKKVVELLEAFFIYHDVSGVMQDPNGVEVKTLTSALKKFLQELKEPLIPYHLYYKLVNVAKTSDSKEDQISHVHSIIHQLPRNHFRAIKKIVEHFTRIIAASEKTKMTAANMSTCVGTSLLHSEGKSIANVMEIKFVNQIVLVILNNFHQIFETTPTPFSSASKLSRTRMVSGNSSKQLVSQNTTDPDMANRTIKSGGRSPSVDSLLESNEEHRNSTALQEGSRNTSIGREFKRDRPSLRGLRGAQRPNSLDRSDPSRNCAESEEPDLPKKSRERRPSAGFAYKAPLLRIGATLPRGFSRKSKSMTPLPQGESETNKEKSSKVTKSKMAEESLECSKEQLQTLPRDFGFKQKCLTPLLPLKRSNRVKKDTVQENKAVDNFGDYENLKNMGTMNLTKSPSLKIRKGFNRQNSRVHFGSDEQLDATDSKVCGSSITSDSSSYMRMRSNSSSGVSSVSHNCASIGGNSSSYCNPILGSYASTSMLTGSGVNDMYLKRLDSIELPKMNPFGPKNTCVRTLFDCTGDPNLDELSFNANQIIVNVTLSDEPGWLRGTLNGRVGLFPANYVQIVDHLECLKLPQGINSSSSVATSSSTIAAPLTSSIAIDS
ncbi:rho GTPase-activating protein 26-like isoform X4 [Convolutriloba macropyga]|uniref:rho GTPase-activating protein 26-like isoform X4 n=1 Tax=Convolutriloba macropyga TaxID=536237 RepID=UPI003F51F01C